MLSSKILDIVQKKHEITGGHCGVYVKFIEVEFKCKSDLIEQAIEDLHNQGKIELRVGIHGLMIKLLDD